MRIAMTALLLSGCTVVSDLDGQACETDLDCDEGRACSANNLCLLVAETRACARTDQCSAGEVCAAGVCAEEEAARWGCASGMPEQSDPDSEQVTLRLQVVTRPGSLMSDAVAPENSVLGAVCADADCLVPENTFTANEAGLLEMTLTPGFQGFVRLMSDGLMDTLYQLQAPVTASTESPVQVMMLSASEVSTMAEAAGAQVNLDERGIVVFQISDCLGERSEGISVADIAQDPEVDIVYFSADQNLDLATATTSTAGLAIALDAAVGAPEYKLTRASASKDLDSLAVSTVAGAVTYLSYQFGR